jgi:hypothetical protein
MAESRVALESSCTLDALAFRVREQEFRSLFSRALLDVQRVDARTGRLRLDPGCESELRDLLAREKRCCSCFGFEVESTEERLAVTVRAPAGSEAALAGLLELA